MSKLNKNWNTINVVSDGTPLGTVITDSKGARIDGVTNLKWEIDAAGLGKAILTFVDVSLKVSNIKYKKKTKKV